MILILRGHIRDSFETKDLYDFIETIHRIFPNVQLFMHTWNIVANNISWRKINMNHSPVDKEIIHNYFGELSTCIRHIIIDDDQYIQLHGNISGTINNGPMPILGWKNYWYGKYKIVEYIYNQHTYDEEMIVNIRFDIFSNSNRFDKDVVIDFIKNNSEMKFSKNIFLFDHEHVGIDNIYIGNIHTMYKLANIFYHELDDILTKHTDTENQEKLVYRINSFLFDKCIDSTM